MRAYGLEDDDKDERDWQADHVRPVSLRVVGNPELMAKILVNAQPDISNNVGPVKHFLSRLLHSLKRVFLPLPGCLSDRRRQARFVRNLAVGFSPTQTSRVLSSALFRRVKVPLALG
jgi:hypothetical protein